MEQMDKVLMDNLLDKFRKRMGEKVPVTRIVNGKQ
jgi:hypothetical protein